MQGHDAPGRTDAPSARADGASWRPILTGSARERALEAVDRLAADIAAAQDGGERPADPTLSAGRAGHAVLFAHLACAGQDEGAAGHAARCLDVAVDTLASTRLGASLYAGFTGVAWAAELVRRLLDPGGEDLNEAIDDALEQLLAGADLEHEPFDVIYGLTGLGVYALERWPRPGAVDAIARIAAHFDSRASRDGAGAYWPTAPALLLGPRRQEYPDGAVDLGVAHGIAGVIPFLARAAALGAGPPSEGLVEDAVRWLLAHAVEGESGPTIPYLLADGVRPLPARSAWCYGDPGVAAALLVAAQNTREPPSWVQDAIGLAVRAARRPPHLTGVVDAGICHGSAGLAHLFNRMFQLTGEAPLADAALFWLERTLDLCAGDEPGRLPWAPEAQAAWNGLGVLEGTAGIALVLLAASTTVEPEWDRMFLASPLAPRARPLA